MNHAADGRGHRVAGGRRGRAHRAPNLCLVAALAAASLVLAACGSGAKPANSRSTAGAAHPARPVSGGPLAPARVGGLPALWAPGNVVAPQPGTAAAYAAASRQPGPAGYIVIADRGNNRMLLVNPQKQVVWLFPTQADLAAGKHLYYNDDTFVEPGGRKLIANEEDNHTIVEVGVNDHSLKLLYGQPLQPGTGPGLLNTPDDAYALPDGSVTVADAYNCRILFIRAGQIVRQYGHTHVCRHQPPDYLGAVNGDTPEPDGGVLISEIPGHWVDEIGPDGRLRLAVKAPVSYPSDPQPLPGGRILLADYANPGHALIMSRRGVLLWRYGPSSGPGRMDHPSLAMALPNGNVAVNDDFRHRVIVIDPRTKRIVWQYGHTDVAGRSPGYLNTPDGMDFVPAGPDGRPAWSAVVHP